MSDAWHAFRAFVERTEDLPIGMLVRGGCHRDPGDEVAAAYDAPFPNAASKAGARAFPRLIPQTPDAPGAAAGRRVLEALREDERPMLLLWADRTRSCRPRSARRSPRRSGSRRPASSPRRGHFLQEDQGAGGRRGDRRLAGPRRRRAPSARRPLASATTASAAGALLAARCS